MKLHSKKKYKELLKRTYKERRLLIAASVAIVAIWLLLYILYLPDGKLRLVFCDVGQGDGIYIEAPDGSDILIDGGPNRKVLQCLGNNMPFWDKKLEIVILTHAQADHLNGLIEVLERYEVGYFVTSPVGNETKGYRRLVGLIQEKDVPVKNLYSGDTIKIPNSNLHKFSIFNLQFSIKSQLPIFNLQTDKLPEETEFRVLWPSREFVAEKIDQKTRKTQLVRNSVGQKASISDNQTIRYTDSTDTPIHRYTDPLSRSEFSEINILGAKTTHNDLNDFSVVLELKFGEFEALLGGDADEEIQDDILGATSQRIGPVEVFKIPHHGSKYGILDEYLEEVEPSFAVVSVGKNRWGHPDKSILERLEIRGLRVWRTDKDGDVKVITDGKQIWVKSDK